jgi:hypothetical protein
VTIEQILAWADAHHVAVGRWPAAASGKVLDAPGESWSALNDCLSKGGRGLLGGQSLSRLLEEHRSVRRGKTIPQWTAAQVLAWADAYHAAHGRWPTSGTRGPAAAEAGASWQTIDRALKQGTNGLPGEMSLSRLIIAHRGPAASNAPPPLTLTQVRTWMEAHRAATGKWPTSDSGPVRDAPHPETWKRIQTALREGRRGLPPRHTLARLRPDGSTVRTPLTVDQILAWVDAHHAATGRWPTHQSGAVDGTDGETWSRIDGALSSGYRGLPRGTSLARLLAAERGVRSRSALPGLTCDQILTWADAHHAATGRWPCTTSGAIPEAPGETWARINEALRRGRRGLSAGWTLVRLLTVHRTSAPPGLQDARDSECNTVLSRASWPRAWAEADSSAWRGGHEESEPSAASRDATSPSPSRNLPSARTQSIRTAPVPRFIR